MYLDGLTLMTAGSFVSAIGAFLLLGAWIQVRATALLWWAVATLANAASIIVLAFGIATNTLPAVAAGAGIGTLAPIFTWCGARSFNGRGQLVFWIIAGPLVLAVAGLLPSPAGPEVTSESVGFAVWVAYLVAAGVELWRGHEERLPARLPLIGFMALHALVFTGGVFDALAGNMPAGVIPPLSSWFSMIHFEGLIFVLGTVTFMVLLCKERVERRQMIASLNDSLTGIANRGAFLHSAERTLRRCQADAVSFSLIMFDLDRFKWINDTFGHDVGDEVLRMFAQATRSVLRPNDLFGRYGGEEFVVVLPGATVEAAYVIAERVRHRFAEEGAFTGQHATNATVSAGVASASSVSTLDTVMRSADQSMYRAKSLGRNRVERMPPDRQQDEQETLIRIA